MQWSDLWGPDTPPAMNQISDFVESPLWAALNSFLQEYYHIAPKITYSKCPLQKGWNVKYQKSGRALCTLYPMPGYFIALVVIGQKDLAEADLIIEGLCSYVKTLYQNTPFCAGGKWLMIGVTDEEILCDVQSLIGVRVPPHRSR